MAIIRGDVITASDILDKTLQCFDDIRQSLGNNWSTEWQNSTQALDRAYSKNRRFVKMQSGANILAEINSLHTSESYADTLMENAMTNYKVLKSQPISVAGLVSCMLSCFTTMTSLRMALYTFDGSTFNYTQTLFKSGINYPSYKSWDNQYTALLSSNYENRITPGGLQGAVFVNRACSNGNAVVIGNSSTKISSKVGWKAAGQIRLDKIVDSTTGYYSKLSSYSGQGAELGGGHRVIWPQHSLGSYVPSITNFSHDSTTVELKKEKVIFAHSVTALYDCLESLNKTIASAYYGCYTTLDEDSATTIIRYHVLNAYINGGTGYTHKVYNAIRSDTRYKVLKWKSVFTGVKKLYQNYVFGGWKMYEHDDDVVPLPSQDGYTNVNEGDIINGFSKKYVDIWLDVTRDWKSYVLSWGTWATEKNINVFRPTSTIHDALSAANKMGIPGSTDYDYDSWKDFREGKKEWLKYLDGNPIPWGQDNLEFCTGIVNATGYSPGVEISKVGNKVKYRRKNKNNEYVDFSDINKLHGVIDWGVRGKSPYVKRWATMQDNTLNAEAYWAGMTELSATINELTRTHAGLAVVLVDGIRYKDIAKFNFTELYKYVPSLCKQSISEIRNYLRNNQNRAKVEADGVYLINRYGCHPSLHPSFNVKKELDQQSFCMWGGIKSVAGFPGRLNTYLSSTGTTGQPIRDGWGKPMWFQVDNQYNGDNRWKSASIKIHVLMIRSGNVKEVAGFDQSWGEGAKFYLSESKNKTKPPSSGNLLTYPSYIKIKNENGNWESVHFESFNAGKQEDWR